MLDYLKKFNNLPAELRKQVSSKEAMAALEELEKKYQLPLASFVMRVMVKEIAVADLALFLFKENLTEAAAGQLVKELKKKIFFSLKDYLSPPVQQTGPAEQSVAPLPKIISASAPKPLVKGASFFFSPDDEQEIRELAKKIDLAEKIELPASPAGGPAEKIEAELKQIINRTQINFGSANLADRFKQILKTYLRGIRNRLETELTLTKPFLSGGLSFDENSARKVMVMADKIVHPVKFDEAGAKPAGEPIKLSEKISIPKLEKTREEKLTISRDAPYDFSKLAKEKEIFALPESRPKSDRPRVEDAGHELAPLTPTVAVAKPGAAFPVQKKEPLLTKIDNQAAAPADQASQMPLIRRRFEAENLSQNQKVRVEDVKYVPRVMSPLDEIKYLDLINFRRLDKDPQKAADKIRSKINLLEEESYGKKLAGIRFWRSSPINKLYLEIGHLSISGNKPVDVIIEERKIAMRDYLTAAEFKAIMDLNKSLRF